MPDYRHKDNVRLAYDANKKRLRAEASIILDAIMNEALAEMTEQFNEALLRGSILEISGSREEMQSYLRKAADKQLGPGS